MSNREFRLSIRITADGKVAASEVDRVTSSLNQLQDQGRRAGQGAGAGLDQAGAPAQRLANAVSTVTVNLNVLVQTAQQAGRSLSDSANQAAASVNRIEMAARSAQSGLQGMVGQIAAIGASLLAFKASQSAMELPRMGIEFAKQMEVAQLGMAGTLVSMTRINGAATSMAQGMAIAGDMMAKLNDDALRTSASSQELIGTFQAILGPALAAKMTLEQVRTLVVTGVNATKSLGLASNQVVQELRDLVQGGITPASSTLATALGITDADIKRVKAQGGDLFAFLMDRMKGYEQASAMFGDTLAGRLDALQEGMTRVAAAGFAPLIEATKGWASQLSAAVIDTEQKLVSVNGKLQQVTQYQLNPQSVAALQDVAQIMVSVGNAVGSVTGVLIEHRSAIGTLATAYLGYKVAALAVNGAVQAQQWLVSKAAILEQAIATEQAKLAALNAAQGQLRRAEATQIAATADLNGARAALQAAQATQAQALADEQRLGMLAALAAGQQRQIAGSNAVAMAEQRLAAAQAELTAAQAARNTQTIQGAAVQERITLATAAVAEAEAVLTASRQRLTIAESEALAMENALAAAQTRRIATTEALAVAETQQATAMGAAATATLATRTATVELAAAQGAANLATQGGAVAAGAARGALAMLGGPIGAISLALMAGVVAWQAFGSASQVDAQIAVSATGDVIAKTDELIKKLKERNKLQGKDEAVVKQTESLQDEIRNQAAHVQELETKAQQAAAQRDAGMAQTWATSAEAARQRLNELAAKANELATTAQKVNQFDITPRFSSQRFQMMVDQFAPKTEKLAAKLEELKKLREEEETLAAGDKKRLAEIARDAAQAEAGIRDKFKPKGGGQKAALSDAYQAQLQQLQSTERLAQESLQRQSKELDAQLKRRQTSYRDYYASLKTATEASYAKQIDAGLAKLNAAKAKGDRSDIAKFEGEVNRLTTERDDKLAQYDDDLQTKVQQTSEQVTRLVESAQIEALKGQGKLVEAERIKLNQDLAALQRDIKLLGTESAQQLLSQFDQYKQSRLDKAQVEEWATAGKTALAEFDDAMAVAHRRNPGGLWGNLGEIQTQLDMQRQYAGKVLDELQRARQKAIETGLVAEQRALDNQIRDAQAKLTEIPASLRSLNDDISQGLADAIGRGFENGKTIAENFRDSVNAALKTIVMRPMVEAVTQPMANVMTQWLTGASGANNPYGSALQLASWLGSGNQGSPGGSQGDGSSSGGNLMGNASTMAGLMNSAWFKGAATTVGKWLGLVKTGSTVTGHAALGNATTATSLGKGMATVAPWVIAAIIGNMIAMRNGYSLSNTKTGFAPVDYGSLAMHIGKAIGGESLGNLMGGGIHSAIFGRGAPELTGMGLRGTFSVPGQDGQSGWFGMLRQDIHEKGSLFRGSKDTTNFSEAPAEIVNALNSAFRTVLTSSRDFATQLGVNAQVLDGYSKSMDITLDKDADPAKIAEALEKAMQEVNDDIAKTLIPNIKDWAKQGERAGETLQRLSGNFTATDAVLWTLGRSSQQAFAATGLASANARTELVEYAGGTQALGQATAQFYSDYFSTLEHTGRATRELEAAMKAVGVETLPHNRAEFRRLAEAADLSTQAGRQQYAALMKALPAMDQYVEALAAQTKTITGWNGDDTGKALFEAVFDARNADEAGQKFADAFGESFQRAITGMVTGQVGQMIFDGLITPMSTAALAQAQAVTIGGATAGAAMQTGGELAGQALISSAQQAAVVDQVKRYLDSMGKILSDPAIKAAMDAIKPLFKDFGASTYDTTAAYRSVTGYRPKAEQDKDADRAADEARKRAEDLAEFLRDIDGQLASMGRSDAAQKLAEINKNLQDHIDKLKELGGTSAANLLKLQRLHAAQLEQIAVDVWKRSQTALGHTDAIARRDLALNGQASQAAYAGAAKSFGMDSVGLDAWLKATGQTLEQAAVSYWGAMSDAQRQAVILAVDAKAGYIEAIKSQFDAQSQAAQALERDLNNLRALSSGIGDDIANIQIEAGQLNKQQYLGSQIATGWERLGQLYSAGASIDEQIAQADKLKSLILDRYRVELEAEQKRLESAREFGDYLKSLKVSDKSNKTVSERLSEADKQLVETQQKAQGMGDEADKSRAKLTQLSDQYLELARQRYGSGTGYDAALSHVQTLIGPLADSGDLKARELAQQTAIAERAKQAVGELQTLQRSVDGVKGVTAGKFDIANTRLKDIHDQLGKLGVDMSASLQGLSSELRNAITGTVVNRPPAGTVGNSGTVGGVSQGRDSLRDAALANQVRAGDLDGALRSAVGLGYNLNDMLAVAKLVDPKTTLTAPQLAQLAREHHIPGFAVGTNHVPSDMLALIHQGERIVPAADNRELLAQLRERNSLAPLLERLITAVEQTNKMLAASRSDQQKGDLANVEATLDAAAAVVEAVSKASRDATYQTARALEAGRRA